jgi:hypothetical protein
LNRGQRSFLLLALPEERSSSTICSISACL